MPAKERLGVEDVQQAVVAYRDALRAHQDRLNRLNVYPVPDGDTGTNMVLTVEAVVSRLDGATDMAQTCEAIGKGSLMGARGNSGVILSQILRGLSHGLASAPEPSLDASTFAGSLSAATEAAYQAVMEPVEGTILTVLKDASAAAAEAADDGLVLAEVLDRSATAARQSLDRTPELLPVLAEAGVVDAGGAGLVLLFDAFLFVADRRPIPVPEPVTERASEGVAAAHRPQPVAHAIGSTGIGPRYEVMYFLEAPDEGIDGFKRAWEAVGTSIVVVGGDGLWNCHIHTDDIGAAVEAGIDVGRPRDIRVTDLADQVEHERCRRQEPHPPVKTAVVAVGAGAGMVEILKSLGVQEVVTGGRSINPSTEEILAAVEATGGEEVVVLPNDKNVIPVAEQVPALASKPVRVVPTRGVPQGLAALVDYDAGEGADTNAAAMEAAAQRVAWGEVTRAVRAASVAAGDVREGDWLGLEGDQIVVVQPGLEEATRALLDRLLTDRHELVSLFTGADADEEVTERVTGWLASTRPALEVEVHRAGQGLSAYLVSAE